MFSLLVVVLLALFISGVCVGWCSDSYFGVWGGMEVASLAVFPLMLIKEKNEVLCSVVINYYVVQVISSTLLFLGVVVLWSNMQIYVGVYIGLVGLLMKFGGVFLGWLVSAVEGMSWFCIAISLGVQKLPVLAMLMWSGQASDMAVMVLSGVFIGLFSVLSYCVCSVRSFLVISSLMNSGWIWCGLAVDEWGGLAIFMLYQLYFVILCMVFSSQFWIEYGMVWYGGFVTSVLESVLLAVVSGLPPFVVFFCKIEISWSLVSIGFSMESLVLMIFSSFLIYIYVNLMFTSLVLGIIYSSSNKIVSLAWYCCIACGVFSALVWVCY